MLGIRIAGPALAAIFLVTLAMGFISRTMPQLNILAAGFPLRITIALVLLIASLGSVCFLIEDKLLRLLSGLGTIFV
jgi:flagellar biosynthetic protein FliR